MRSKQHLSICLIVDKSMAKYYMNEWSFMLFLLLLLYSQLSIFNESRK